MHESESVEKRDDEKDEAKPDVHELERSISARRSDLLSHVHELERVVRAKLDVKSRLRNASERGIERAENLFAHVVTRIREQPVPYIVLGGVILMLLFRRRPRRMHLQLH
jgi:hypothetical protein